MVLQAHDHMSLTCVQYCIGKKRGMNAKGKSKKSRMLGFLNV